jgi:hypothetical protein
LASALVLHRQVINHQKRSEKNKKKKKSFKTFQFPSLRRAQTKEEATEKNEIITSFMAPVLK